MARRKPRPSLELAKAQENNCPEYPLKCFPAFQWKYDLDEDAPWWKRLYFRLLWLPFARFSYLKVKIIPFERLEPDGSLSWKEFQGVFLKEQDAQRESSKYDFGGYSVVSFNAPEPRKSIIGRTHFPNSTAFAAYEECIAQEEAAASSKLRASLQEAQTVIDRYRSSR